MKVQLNARNRAYEFDAAPGEKILFAGLRARVDLPYECGTGTCGTCKARLVDGRIDDGWPEAPGRKYLKGAGEFLMCQCAAAGDVPAEVASFVYPADSGAFPVADVAGVVAGARALTPDVMETIGDKFMVRVDKDKQPEISKQNAPDGEYIPRTYFLSSDGVLDPALSAKRERYRYFYNESDPKDVLAAMDSALAKLGPKAK